jgi:hypothetical protein
MLVLTLEDRKTDGVVVLVILVSNCTAAQMNDFFPVQVSKEIFVRAPDFVPVR